MRDLNLWNAKGRELCPKTSRERARGLHEAQGHPPRRPRSREAATISLHCGLSRAQGFLTLGRRRTPTPLGSPGCPLPLPAPRLIQTVFPKPRAAPRFACESPFLTRRYRRRSLPGAAPNPPRGVGDRVGVSLLLAKQRSRRRRCQARGEPGARARSAPAGRPPNTRSPRACYARARLPPTQSTTPASAARPASCARQATLPLPVRTRRSSLRARAPVL